MAVASNFSGIPVCIRALEEHGQPLGKATGMVEGMRMKMKLLPEEFGVVSQFERVMDGNTGLVELCLLRDVMLGSEVGELAHISAEDIPLFKFAPIVSCEVERSFSRYKNIFRDSRHRFLFENLKKFVIVACNQSVS